MNNIKQILTSCFLYFFLLPILWIIYAQIPDVTFQAKITDIKEDKKLIHADTQLFSEQITVTITSGTDTGKSLTFDQMPTGQKLPYKIGSEVILNASVDQNGNKIFYIADIVRTDALKTLFIMFIGISLMVGGIKSIRSLMGLAFSFFIILKLILPQLLSGANPVLTAVLGCLLIAPVSFYLTHGRNRSTTIALMGTLVALTITAILGSGFIDHTMLTGMASEETQFLTLLKGTFDMKGLVLAGIIIGALGVLDDVTISQTSIVRELYDANSKLTHTQLFWKAMRVGQDHVASTINTLVLVYVGAALPLLLLFINSSQPTSQLLSYEIVAEEIVRTLVGSIGLISAIPITTLMAVWFIPRKEK